MKGRECGDKKQSLEFISNGKIRKAVLGRDTQKMIIALLYGISMLGNAGNGDYWIIAFDI